MVPEKGACPLDRDLQFGNERRCTRDAAARSDHRAYMGMARSIHYYRCSWFHLASVLARHLQTAGSRHAFVQARAGVYPERPGGADCPSSLETLIPAPTDVGFRDR